MDNKVFEIEFEFEFNFCTRGTALRGSIDCFVLTNVLSKSDDRNVALLSEVDVFHGQVCLALDEVLEVLPEALGHVPQQQLIPHHVHHPQVFVLQLVATSLHAGCI